MTIDKNGMDSKVKAMSRTMEWVKKHLKYYKFPDHCIELKKEIKMISDEDEKTACYHDFWKNFYNNFYYDMYGVDHEEALRDKITCKNGKGYFVYYEKSGVYIPLEIYGKLVRGNIVMKDWEGVLEELERKEGNDGGDDWGTAKKCFRESMNEFEAEVKNYSRSYSDSLEAVEKRGKYKREPNKNVWYVAFTVIGLVILFILYFFFQSISACRCYSNCCSYILYYSKRIREEKNIIFCEYYCGYK